MLLWGKNLECSLTLSLQRKLLPLHISYGLEPNMRIFGPQGHTTHEHNPSYGNAKVRRKSVFMGCSNLERFFDSLSYKTVGVQLKLKHYISHSKE